MSILLLDVLTTAAILFAVASGLMIILGVMKLINFAHGAFLTVGGYAAYLTTLAGLNPWFGGPLAFLFGAACGMAIERVIVRPLYDRPLDAILATWGLGIIIGQLITLGFGREVQFAAESVERHDRPDGRRLLGLSAGGDADRCRHRRGADSVVVSTRFGLNARAVIMNERLAQGLGIDSTKVRAITFGLGAGLACAAGALITPLLSVDPNMGLPWLVNSFMLVLVSGVSIPSLALASLLLGGAQVAVSTYVSPILGGLTIVVLAAVILRINPRGLSVG